MGQNNCGDKEMFQFLLKHLYKDKVKTISLSELKQMIEESYNGKHLAYLLARLDDLEEINISKSSADTFISFLKNPVCDMLVWALFVSEVKNYNILTIQKTFNNSFFFVEFQSEENSMIDAFDLDNFAITELTSLDKICNTLRRFSLSVY